MDINIAHYLPFITDKQHCCLPQTRPHLETKTTVTKVVAARPENQSPVLGIYKME